VLSNEDAVAASHVIGLGAERTVASVGMRRVIVATVIALIVVSSCSSKRSSQAATVAWYTTETHSFDIAFIGRSWITAKPSNVISSYNAGGVVDLVQNALELTGRDGDEIDIGLDSWSKTPRPHVPGKPWVHYHQDPRLPFPGFNPASVLLLLERSRASLKLVSHDVIRGVPTSRYELVLPTPTSTTDPFTAGNGRIDVWVDSNDLIRQYQATSLAYYGMTKPYASETVELIFQLFNFGVAAHIEPPAPDQVTDANQGGASTSH
jgi:hypothetical protein